MPLARFLRASNVLADRICNALALCISGNLTSTAAVSDMTSSIGVAFLTPVLSSDQSRMRSFPWNESLQKGASPSFAVGALRGVPALSQVASTTACQPWYTSASVSLSKNGVRWKVTVNSSLDLFKTTRNVDAAPENQSLATPLAFSVTTISATPFFIRTSQQNTFQTGNASVPSQISPLLPGASMLE